MDQGEERLSRKQKAEAERDQKRLEKERLEAERLEQLCTYEKQNEHYQWIAGIDEVGRGCFAGPVMAACVILPKELRIPGINDSKKLSEKKREALYGIIREKALAIGIGMVEAPEIDRYNILQATYQAMRKAVDHMSIRPDLLLVDAVTIPEMTIPQIAIVKGDAKSQSIAAASIVAKVTRDKMMRAYAEQFPVYRFEKNKGYGTPEHIAGIRKEGPCYLHRRSFIHRIWNE